MSAKQYLKMADVFIEQLDVREKSPRLLDCCGILAANFLNEDGAKYAAHAINSHDELVAENERLREALECAASNFHDAAKIVQDGWQLVPVEPTIDMVQAATHSAVGFGTRAAYQAMLSAAPKHDGSAS